MTIRHQTLLLGTVAIVFTGILSGVLFRRAHRDVTELRTFDKVGRMLVLMSSLSDSMTDETNFSWDAWNDVHNGQAGKGKRLFDEAVATTDGLLDELDALVASMNLADYSERFQAMVGQELGFRGVISPLRGKVVGPGQVENNWPTTQEYQREVERLVMLIPSLASETTHGQLLRRMVVAESLVRFKLRYSLQAGAMFYFLQSGFTNESSRANSSVFLSESKTLLRTMHMFGTPELEAQLQEHLDNAHLANFLRICAAFYAPAESENPEVPKGITVSESELRTLRADLDALDEGVATCIAFACDEITSFAGREIRAAEWGQVRALAVGLCCMVACGVLGWIFAGRMTRAIEGVSDTLNTEAVSGLHDAEAFSHASQRLAEGGSEQAAATEEIGASMEEMHGSARSNLSRLEDLLQIGQQSNSAAAEGAQAMAQLTAAMADIQQSGSQIAVVTKTIEEIAFQTNLLALNAAVEAARAGEAGAGFAVVADEVRNLAKKSAESAGSTRTMIERAIRQITHGHTLTTKVDGHLGTIADFTGRFRELVAEVSETSNQQCRAIEQITGGIHQIDKVTQANAASAEETASMAEALERRSELMLTQTRHLQALCGKAAAAARAVGHPVATPRPAAPRHPAPRPAGTPSANGRPKPTRSSQVIRI